MCTPWKASALKKAVQAARTVPTHPFFRNGLGWGSAVQTLGHIRNDMSGPSVGHIPLRNSHAIAKFSWLLNGAHSCAAPSYFFHMRTVCLFYVIYIDGEVS